MIIEFGFDHTVETPHSFMNLIIIVEDSIEFSMVKVIV